jgi:hypothetical protein
MASGFICQGCGIEAPTKRLAYYQNIGALVMRFHKRIDGNLCKRCSHRYFWKFTPTTLVLGWWGTISLIVTPFFILNNIGRYLTSLTMPAVPPDARVPELTADVIAKLGRVSSELIERMNRGETLETVAPDFARRTGVTPGQVVRYVQYLIQQQRQRHVPPPVQKTYGFPVQPAQPLPPIPLEPTDPPAQSI